MHRRRGMVRKVGVHRTNNRHVVDMAGERCWESVRKREFPDFPALMNFTGEGSNPIVFEAVLNVSRLGTLPCVFLIKAGFGIKRINLRRAATHKQEDHTLRFREQSAAFAVRACFFCRR